MEMSEAREIAAQCWCDERTSDRAMDAVLAEVFAEQLVSVYNRGIQHTHNAKMTLYKRVMDRRKSLGRGLSCGCKSGRCGAKGSNET